MNQEPVLETRRLYLKPVSPADFDEISAILGDPEVMYAWEHAFSDEEIHDWIAENLRRYERDGYSYWSAALKDTGKIIGVAGIIKEEADDEEYTGLGYIFNKAFWRQGFAFECAEACRDYAFGVLNVPLLTAQIRPENTSSRKVAEKLGMTVIKLFKRLYRGKSMPHLLYGCRK